MMKRADRQNPQNSPQKSGRSPVTPPVADRPSLSGERAEGEGMIAPEHDPVKKTTPAKPAAEVEGEGSYSATRRYDEGVQRSVAKGDVERLAKEAAQALDGPEGDELRRAEQAAKRGHA